MDEIKEAFYEESQELFENISSLLIEAEESGQLDEEKINGLFRDIHTLKGGSGSVGFVKFAKIIHIFENFLDKLRNNEIVPNDEILTFLVDASDTLADILAEELNDELDDGRYNENFEYFSKEIERLSNKKPSSSDGATSTDGGECSIQSKDELLKLNGGEIIDLFDRIKDLLQKYENSGFNDDNIKTLFREYHTLKASAQYIGLKFFVTYVHELENFIDKIRENELSYNDKVHGFIKEFTAKAEEVVDLEINNDLKTAEVILSNLKNEIKSLSGSKSAEEQGFEIFDEKDEKSIEEQGFEIFDENAKPAQEQKPEIKPTSIPEAKPEVKPALKPEAKPALKQKKDSDNSANGDKKSSLKKIVTSSSIRVNLDKIDLLMNKVGDLVITKSMLFQFAEVLKDYQVKNLITEKLEVLDRNIRELQESVMSVRMIPMSSVYQKLPKIIRDLSKKLHKSVRFNHFGDTVEIDKLMVEALMDPLTHILRNALDHGIESPDTRIKKNKPKEGTLNITASQESGQIIITIEDDGAGINIDRVGKKAVENGVVSEDELRRMDPNDIAMLIFSPGLSTAEKITDVSGRGVGMDVVMNNINAIGGTIKIFTKMDIGTKFVIILPLTLAILDGLNVRVGKYKFVYPLNMVLESFQPIKDIVKSIVKDGKEVLIVRDEFIPVIRLHEFFNIEPDYKELTNGIIIVSKIDTSKVAIFVDEFMTQEQIVVKSLEKNFRKVKGISASTIRGDGSVGLILDIVSIVNENKKLKVSNGDNDI